MIAQIERANQEPKTRIVESDPNVGAGCRDIANCSDEGHASIQQIGAGLKTTSWLNNSLEMYMIKSCEIDLTQHCKGPRLALNEDLIVVLGCWLRGSVSDVISNLPHSTPHFGIKFQVLPFCINPASNPVWATQQ